WNRQRHGPPRVEGDLRGAGRYLSLVAEQYGGGPRHLDAAVRKPGDSGRLHAHRCRDLLRGNGSRLRRVRRRRVGHASLRRVLASVTVSAVMFTMRRTVVEGVRM